MSSETTARARTSRRPSVRVVVPCYNYGHYLPECVDSVLSQDGVEVEVLIIDDASPDGSADVARALAQADARVQVIAHEENRGHIRTYNEGLSSAASDYLVLLSADDMLAPGALARATRIMEDDPRVGLVYGHPETFTDAPPAPRGDRSRSTIWRGPRWIDHQFRRGLSIIYSPEAVVRTSVHRAAGWYRPELPHSGDLEMWLRIADIADVARIHGPDQAYRRVHAASMMQTSFSSPLVDLKERVAAYESFLAGSALPPRVIGRLRRTMRRGLASEAIAGLCEALAAGRTPDAVERSDTLAFAEEMDADYRSLTVWREYAARSGLTSGPLARCWIVVGSAQRRIQGIVRWRRWRHRGI